MPNSGFRLGRWLVAAGALWLLAVGASVVAVGQVAEDEAEVDAALDLPPAPEAPNVEERLGRTTERVAEFLSRDHEVLERNPDIRALLLLKLEKAQALHRLYWPSALRDAQVAANLDALEALLDELGKGVAPDLGTHGRLERAYLSPIDTSPQPYILYVPETYDGAEPFGLLVYLHGYSPDLNKENWVRYMYADVLDDYCTKAGYIMLMPFARSNTDFQGIGEDDVMLTLDKVMRDYNIDPDRVVMSGYSMGGMGAWTIAGHYPHRFAAVLAMAGRGDFYLWKRIGPEDLPPFRRKLAEMEFAANMQVNYTHLPIFLMHGSADWGISVEQSRKMYACMKERGFDVQYVELEGEGHFFFYRQAQAREDLVQWLKTRRLVRAPRSIAHRTYSLKFNRAYWAEILGIEDWDEAAELACEVNEAGDAITVTTKNVLALRLKPPKELAPDPGKLRVVWNGKTVAAEIDGDGRFCLGQLRAHNLVKTPSLCGNLREAYAAPFVMVYGGEEHGKAHSLALEGARDWERLAKGTPRLLPADQVDEQTIEDYNLVLYGTPEDNPIIARIMPELPIKIRDGFYVVGERQYDATQFGLSMIYPNPLRPTRYVVVNSGIPWGRGVAENHKYDMLPDFTIFNEEKAEDNTESNRCVCAGFFNQYWELSDESTWHSDEPR